MSQTKERAKPTLKDLKGVEKVMSRYPSNTTKDTTYGVSNIRMITPTQVQCDVRRIESTGKGSDDFIVLRSSGQGGFARAEDFDFDTALRAAFENAVDNLEGGHNDQV